MDASPPIGLKIKRARERLRWTQDQLAAQVGVSQKTIDNWENDRRYPKSAIGALESVLGISFDDEPGEPENETARLRREVEQLKAESQEWRKLAQALAEQRGKGNEDPRARAV
jgi:transcriptional regulator with XRE-family HTH domain